MFRTTHTRKTLSWLLLSLALVGCQGGTPIQLGGNDFEPNPVPGANPTPTPNGGGTGTTVLGAPALNSPDTHAYTNDDQLNVGGTCSEGATVYVQEEGSEPITQACAYGAFSIFLEKDQDGDYAYRVYQQNTAQDRSESVAFVWTRDTVAPGETDSAFPLDEIHASKDNAELMGSCEDGATIVVSGDAEVERACDNGTFLVEVEKASDGLYTFNVGQRDRAGNRGPMRSHRWLKSSLLPSKPRIESLDEPFVFANNGLMTIHGSCTTGSKVKLESADLDSADILSPAGQWIANCVGGAFTFVLQHDQDGTIDLFFSHIILGIASGKAAVRWVIDSVAPRLDVLCRVHDGAKGALLGLLGHEAVQSILVVKHDLLTSLGAGLFMLPQGIPQSVDPDTVVMELIDRAGNTTPVTLADLQEALPLN